MRNTRPLASAALYTYTLGRSLYVPLTSRCNSLTLPQTRGPEFYLPPDVVAALLRVRDVEHSTQQWHHWCMYLDTQESKQKLPPPLERVTSLPETDGGIRLPSMEALRKEIDSALTKSEPPEALVMAGEGEPTLRWNDLLSLANSYSYMNVRVTTNGLVHSSQVSQLKESGVQALSVALMTANAHQYMQLMEPLVADSSLCAHTVVCNFIRKAVSCELDVEVTGVDRPDVDKEALENLARELGVASSVRWRAYFP